MPTTSLSVIPIIGIGKFRHVAEGMVPFFANTPYRYCAILDFMTSPKDFTYTPHNLGVVLQNVHPRPRVIILGTGLSPEIAEEAAGVWEKYVKNFDVEETLVVNVSISIDDEQ